MVRSFYDFFTIYGEHPGFTVRGQKLYVTALSRCTSLTALICIILVIIFFVKELVIRINPRIDTIILHDLKPLRLNLGDDNFVFAVGLLFPNYTMLLNEKIFNLEVNYISQQQHQNGTITNKRHKLNVTTCDNVYIPVLSNYFATLPLEQMLCIKNKSGVYLEGDMGLGEWGFLDFKFKQCVGNGCYDSNEIDSILKGGYVTIHTSDFTVFPSKYKESKQLYGKNIFSSISNRIYKEIWIYYKSVQFETDDGYFAHTNKTESFYSLRDYTESFDYREDHDKTFLHIYLRTSGTRYIYSRAYEKIDSTMTKIVCMSQLINLLFRFISNIFSKDLYRSYVCSFYDTDFRRHFQNYIITSQTPLKSANKNERKTQNNSSQLSESNCDNIENSNQKILSSMSAAPNNNNNNNNIMNSNIQHIPSCKEASRLTKIQNHSSNNDIINHYNNNTSCFTYSNKLFFSHNNSCKVEQVNSHKQDSDNVTIKKSLYCMNPVVKRSSGRVNTQVGEKEEKSNSAKHKYYMTVTLKPKSPKTCDLNRIPDINKFSDNMSDSKKKDLQESELEKAFKSIQNPNYKMKPFSCGKIMRYLICNVDTFYEYKYIRKCYKNIGLYFDIIKYLKTYQEIEYIKNQILSDKQIKMLQHNFTLEKNPDYFMKQYYKTILCSNKLNL